jgi:LacI family transcriptional regulator
MKLTLEEIGRMAGVSRSTVSRVVNNERSVRPEVRERVQEVIRETGYRPNAAARSLASNRTGVVGLVIPHRVHTLFDDPYFPLLIQGVSQASNLAEVTLSLFLFQSEAEERDLYPRLVGSGTVDGVVITATRMGDPLLERLAGDELPYVVVGRPDAPSGVTYVDTDNRGGARDAALHLCNLGHRRIGYIGAPTNTSAGVDRRSGFLEGLSLCGATPGADLMRDGDYTEESGYRAMRSLLDANPEAVFVATDTMAVGALRALNEANVSVPNDIGLVSFDGLPPSERSLPKLTTVRQPVNETGARAVELLLGLVNGEIEGPVHEVLPTELVIRESCGASRRSAAGPTYA